MSRSYRDSVGDCEFGHRQELIAWFELAGPDLLAQ
jgi:hypothetical protein